MRVATLVQQLLVVDGVGLDEQPGPAPEPLQEDRVGARLSVQGPALDEEPVRLERSVNVLVYRVAVKGTRL